MTEEHRQQTACQQKCANNNWDHVPTKRLSYIAVRRDFSNEKLVALDRSLRRRDRVRLHLTGATLGPVSTPSACNFLAIRKAFGE
jgi:hypothetical protein